MTMSALAGKPAPKGMLVDLIRLEREYYAGQPDMGDPNQRVIFGTSGHRGLAWGSVAALAIVPLQDALNLGNETRMNVPGRADGNWRWRCTEEMVSSCAFEWLRDLTSISDRLQGGSR